MKLRKLKIKDAPLMLEWMHDAFVTEDLHSNFKSKTLGDCIEFVKKANKDKKNLHLAIVNNKDEYMGTVSLKNIDRINKRAEFAIAVRKKAMGHGYSWFGMSEVIKIGLYKEKLNIIYWCVSKNNARACRFYDKHGFNKMEKVDKDILASYKGVDNLSWYCISKSEMENCKSNLFKIINIKTISTNDSGQLSFVESTRDIPFEFKRIYYISKVSEGVKRGFHAHKQLRQLLFCPYGKISIMLDDGSIKNEMILDNPSFGILIDRPLWREMTWLEDDSVLCVLASDYYWEGDYIRDYDSFLEFVGKGEL